MIFTTNISGMTVVCPDDAVHDVLQQVGEHVHVRSEEGAGLDLVDRLMEEKDEEAPLLLLWQVSLKVASAAKVVKGADHFPSSTTTSKMRHYNLQFPHRVEILRYFQIKLE